MSSGIIQSGNLTGSVSSTGTLQANITAEGILAGEISSSGTLQGEITAEKTLQGEMKAEGQLEGTLQMPEKVVVEKSVDKPKINDVTLLASAWVTEEDKRHSQIVEVKDVTNKSQVDLTPDVQQLEVFYEKDVTFVTMNLSSVVTVFAVGQKPMNDYNIQVTLTEVDVPDGTAIWGVTVGTTISPKSLVEKLDIGETLPAVTDEDEGKILKAQGGKWTVEEDETAEALSNIEIEELLRNFT